MMIPTQNVQSMYLTLKYNDEELGDILNDNNRKSSGSLTIREDKIGSILVDGLKEVAVKSLNQSMEVFRVRVGERNKRLCLKRDQA